MNKNYFILTAALFFGNNLYLNAKQPIAAKYCVVYLDKVFQDTEAGKAMNSKINERRGAIIRELQEMQLRLAKIGQEIQSNKMLSEKAKEERMIEGGKLQEEMYAKQADVTKKEQDDVRDFKDLIYSVAQQIAEEQGWDGVFPDAVWVREEANITQDVINALNKKYQEEKKAKEKSSGKTNKFAKTT